MEALTHKLEVAFGKPEYNWLPVHLAMENFRLQFDASGVLQDPLADLVSCLLLVTQGVDASMSWWLEPAKILFEFTIEPQGIQLRILESDDWIPAHSLSKQQIFRVEASYEAVVLPFWRALQKLDPAEFNKRNWSPLPLKKLKKLTELIKARRQLG